VCVLQEQIMAGAGEEGEMKMDAKPGHGMDLETESLTTMLWFLRTQMGVHAPHVFDAAVWDAFERRSLQPADLMTAKAEEALRARYQNIEMLAAAFMTLTKLPADQCELVEQWQGQTLTWHFRPLEAQDAYKSLFKQFDEQVGKTEKLQAENAELRLQLAEKHPPKVYGPSPLREAWDAYYRGDVAALRKALGFEEPKPPIVCPDCGAPHGDVCKPDCTDLKWRRNAGESIVMDEAAGVPDDVWNKTHNLLYGIPLEIEKLCTCKSLLAGHEPGCPHA